MTRQGLGPVFALEWLRTTRRWQLYGMRSLFVLGLLAGILLVCLEQSNTPFQPQSSIRQQAEIGRNLFYFVTGMQISLLLLAAPAATAGGFCLDKARGALLHVLVTDLSSTEIVFGKLAARLAPVLGMIGASVPVLFICTLFGGIDPEALLGAYLVSAGIVFFGCALALTLSVWGKRTHEVLLVVYMLWLVVLLARPLCDGAGGALGLWGSLPRWVDCLNPYWVTYQPYWNPGAASWREPVGFLVGASVGAGLLAILAAARIRAVTVRQASSSQNKKRRRSSSLLFRRLPGPSLNRNPIAWREWRRKRLRGWVGGVIRFYACVAVFFTAISSWQCLNIQGPAGSTMAIFVNGVQVAVGLLFVSVGAVTALSEERVRGSLDVILVTPLPTWKIVWGKWWGVYRNVPVLTILPTFLAAVLAVQKNAWECPALLLPLLLAYGAFFTSVGLAIATCVARYSRAVTLGVVFYAFMTVGWVLVLMMLKSNPRSQTFGLGFGSPGFGALMLSVFTVERRAINDFNYVPWALLWIAGLWIVAALVFLATWLSFNHFLGRVSPRLLRSTPRPPAESFPHIQGKLCDERWQKGPVGEHWRRSG